MKHLIRSTPETQATPRPALGLRVLFSFRKSGRRLPIACRAALSVGVPVTVGWAVGDVSAGLMATIGAFTSLYGSERPYLNRAWLLAGIALSFSVIVTLGVWAQQWALLAVPLVVVIAMAATFVCNSLRIGPPGAYMFALACAAGTALPVPADRVFWLVLGGGAVSWLAHMFGALILPRGPETRAVGAAARAVVEFAQATGAEARDRTCHEAALALHDAWTVLVTFQPSTPRSDSVLTRLREMNRELHLIFAACVNVTDSTAGRLDALASRAHEIGQATTSSGENREVRANRLRVPLGRLPTLQLLLDNLTPGSPASMVTIRVGIAVAVAGAAAATLSLERAYWAMAAAVLVLHMGQDWARTLQRGMERTVGTFVGLGVAAAILAVHPTGLWLVATVMSLQFLTEILVTRNYAFAVVFVTTVALVIASGGRSVSHPGALLSARAIDTVIGCGIGLLIHALVGPRSAPASLRHAIVKTLVTAQAALGHVAAGTVTTNAALRVRRELQHRIFALLTLYETATAVGTSRHPGVSERMWPTVVGTQRLGYKILAACWSLESIDDDPEIDSAPGSLTLDELATVNTALLELIVLVRTGAGSIALHGLPDLLRDEIRDLRDSLASDA